jgi:hypothetical protein
VATLLTRLPASQLSGFPKNAGRCPKKCKDKPSFSFATFLKQESDGRRMRQERGGIQVHAKQLMKRCARCHRKLGLGVRARNLWNGRWWVHVRFCSTHCEALYQQEQYDANAHRWRTFLARRNPQG